MITKCQGCDTLLTDENGVRLQSANFDAGLPRLQEDTAEVTYAWCDKCVDLGVIADQEFLKFFEELKEDLDGEIGRMVSRMAGPEHTERMKKNTISIIEMLRTQMNETQKEPNEETKTGSN